MGYVFMIGVVSYNERYCWICMIGVVRYNEGYSELCVYDWCSLVH